MQYLTVRCDGCHKDHMMVYSKSLCVHCWSKIRKILEALEVDIEELCNCDVAYYDKGGDSK